MKRLLKYAEDILWPKALICLCCDRMSEGELLCPDCRDQLRQLRLPDAEGPVRSIWPYKGCAGKLVRGLKDDCVEDCAKILADEMAEAVRQMKLPADTVLTWVSMPEGRRRMRGIDHGRLLCDEIAARTGMPVRKLLERADRGRPQRGLTREKRMKNLSGRFSCRETLSGAVLLIDDVMTTGATAQTCTEVLMKCGAEAVFVLTAARVI